MRYIESKYSPLTLLVFSTLFKRVNRFGKYIVFTSVIVGMYKWTLSEVRILLELSLYLYILIDSQIQLTDYKYTGW